MDYRGDGPSAIDLLVAQHREIADLFRRTADARGADRATCFFRLRRLLAVHETAEEMLIHPRCRWALHDDPLANLRVEEEVVAKNLLVALEQTDLESPEFAAGLEKLRAHVLAHAGAEERDEFPALAGALEDKSLRRLHHAVSAVEKIAPTRPHPDIALGGENLLGGGFLTLLDRARDLIAAPH